MATNINAYTMSYTSSYQFAKTSLTQGNAPADRKEREDGEANSFDRLLPRDQDGYSQTSVEFSQQALSMAYSDVAARDESAGNNALDPNMRPGDEKLSAKAKEFLDSLREKYGDYDFFATENVDDPANFNIPSDKKYSVFLTPEEIEHMANDEEYAAEVMGKVDDAVGLVKTAEAKGKEKFGEDFQFDRVAISFKDDGTVKLLAEWEKMSAQDRERMEKLQEKQSEEEKEQKAQERKKELTAAEQARYSSQISAYVKNSQMPLLGLDNRNGTSLPMPGEQPKSNASVANPLVNMNITSVDDLLDQLFQLDFSDKLGVGGQHGSASTTTSMKYTLSITFSASMLSSNGGDNAGAATVEEPADSGEGNGATATGGKTDEPDEQSPVNKPEIDPPGELGDEIVFPAPNAGGEGTAATEIKSDEQPTVYKPEIDPPGELGGEIVFTAPNAGSEGTAATENKPDEQPTVYKPEIDPPGELGGEIVFRMPNA